MSRELADVLAEVRAALIGGDLVRAVVSGRRRGETPPWRRVELRPVDLKSGRHLQIVSHSDTQAFTSNYPEGSAAVTAIDEVLALPFANWHVETTEATLQARATKKGDGLIHRSAAARTPVATHHDRAKPRFVPLDDPLLRELGLADAQGRLKPSRERKDRQVEEFLAALVPVVEDALAAGHLRRPTADDPLRVADLGCGNGYLTFGILRALEASGIPVQVIGVDVKEQSREHNSGVATRIGVADRASFAVGTIDGVLLDPPPDVVVALHACDTATDDVLGRAVEWGSPVVLAAPCCHHDIAAQLAASPRDDQFAAITRHGILRERLADTLTDALRAVLLRTQGYRVDVIEFVASQHTPRNTLIRAVRTGHRSRSAAAEAAALTEQWHVRPALAGRLDRTS